MKNRNQEIIEKLQDNKSDLAGRITVLHFEKHPELEKRYGITGRKKCYEDAIFHLDYLIEALRMNSEKLFIHYLEWAFYMLEARNVPLNDLVDNAGFIKKAIREHFPIDDMDKALEFIDAGITHLENLKPSEETHLVPENPLLDEAREYMELLLKGKRRQAGEIIDELVKKDTPIPDIYEHIFQATQYEVGVLWQRNIITVAHEHYCTAATQLIMSRLYPQIFSNKKKGFKMVACSVTSELHEIGIRMISDFFEMDGWDTYYMGSNMPDNHLIEALRENEANLLAISVTLPIHLNKAKELIRKIKEMDEFRLLTIMAGGYPFRMIPDLYKKIGADTTAATARQAIEAANRLVN